MGSAVGTVLPLAVAIAIFPVPIIASALLVGSGRGLAESVAFVASWCAGLLAVGAIALLFAGAADAEEDGGPVTWVSVLLLALGLLSVALAVRQWRSRPGAGEESETPGWMRTIDELTVPKAAAAGLTLSGLNPKNVLLVAAAAIEIAAFGLSAGQQAAALALFVLVASVGVLTPLAITIAFGGHAQAVLEGLRDRMTRHNAAIMTALFLVIGAKLIGDAIAGLSG